MDTDALQIGAATLATTGAAGALDPNVILGVALGVVIASLLRPVFARIAKSLEPKEAK